MEGGGLSQLLPHIPSMMGAAAWHALGMTPTSSKWDLKTAITVQVLRNTLFGNDGKSTPLSKSQAETRNDPVVKGKLWVAKATLKAPKPDEETLRDVVFQAIEDMKPEGVAKLNYTRPELADTYVEWTGYRPNAGKDAPLPDVSEQEKYRQMMAEPSRTSETTILYFHGGAYYLCGPALYRPLASRLAKESHGRVCNVDYRLAPQAAFPSQLLDGFMAYLSLLYPPPGSLHDPVPASSIVFGGDSAGGNLSLALLQLLLQLHRQSPTPTVRFYNRDVSVPLPGGVTASSPWLDISRSMPSLKTNAVYDYLPGPNHDNPTAAFPTDTIWPTTPPRGDTFCDLSLLDHPLASPMTASSWANAPPVFIEMGEEMLSDEGLMVASRMAQQGNVVELEQYEAMPHVFNLLIPDISVSGRCMRSWGGWCRRAVEEQRKLNTKGVRVLAKSEKEENVEVGKAGPMEWEEAMKLVTEAKARRVRGYGGGA